MTDKDAVRAVVLDHFESWFNGDAVRMRRALHPEYSALEELTAQDLLEATARGEGRCENVEDRRIAIEISHLKDNTARVTCLSHRYLEVLQLVRTAEGWKILNGICQPRAGRESLPAATSPGSSETRKRNSGEPYTPILRTFCDGRIRRRGLRRSRRRR